MSNEASPTDAMSAGPAKRNDDLDFCILGGGTLALAIALKHFMRCFLTIPTIDTLLDKVDREIEDRFAKGNLPLVLNDAKRTIAELRGG